jgi:hypothetical protein
LELPVYGYGPAVSRSNLADKCETDAVAPTVVGQALVGQAGGETLEQSRTAYRSQTQG